MFDFEFGPNNFNEGEYGQEFNFSVNEIINQNLDIGTIEVLNFEILEDDCNGNFSLTLRFNNNNVTYNPVIFSFNMDNYVIYNYHPNRRPFNYFMNQLILYNQPNNCNISGRFTFAITAQFPSESTVQQNLNKPQAEETK